MPHLPARQPDRLTDQINQRLNDSDLAIYRAELALYTQQETARLTVNAQNKTIRHAGNKEMDTIDELLEKAGTSRTKQHIAASWVGVLHTLDTAAVQRAFGR